MKVLPVESVFKILRSASIPELVKTLHELLTLYVPLRHTSIGLFSPAGDSLFIAGSTLEEIETAQLVDVSRTTEVQLVLHDRLPILTKPYNHNSKISDIGEENPELPPGSLLFPMEIENIVLGVLILSSQAPAAELDEEKLEIIEDISIAATQALVAIHEKDSYKMEHDRARAEAKSLSDSRDEAEIYSEIFMNNPDGLVVMDLTGRILRFNPAAEGILSKDGNPLPDFFVELVEKEEKQKFCALLQGFQQGIYPRNFEVVTVLPSGMRSIISLSISLVPKGEGYILLTLRDVTQHRMMEKQLAEAKSFMEKILNSSVDAIIAADMKGKIVLFNNAAAALTGWPAEEVIGKKNVNDFYPMGQAKEVMKKLRSEDYGGRGRMEPQKVWLISRSGENIPVLLSAAIIYEDDREAYTCGIFSDLREKLRREEKIAFITEKLQKSEKQVELAELAGAMAHELNQPLTSIYGCSELLMRCLSEDSSYRRYVKIILDEAARMSDIIKKIGKITRYETQPYLGKSQIIDLEKASKNENVG